MVELVGEPEHAALQLDVLVGLVVAGPGARGDRHPLVPAEPVLEEAEVPRLGIAAMAERVRKPRGRMAEPAHVYDFTEEDLA